LGHDDFHIVSTGQCFWNGKSLKMHLLQVKLNGLSDKSNNFTLSLCSGDTSREIRNISSVAGRAFFNNNSVTHKFSFSVRLA